MHSPRSLAVTLSLLFFACSSGDSTQDSGPLADAAQDATTSPDATQSEAATDVATPPPACAFIGDASFPDAYYPSVTSPCTKPGDPCALPPDECVFDRYRIRYTHGYCSSSLACVFSYSRELCSGAEPVGCDAGVCTCGQ